MRAMFKRPKHGSRGGFTLLEMSISAAIFTTFTWMLVRSNEATVSMTDTSSVKAEILRNSQKAMDRILGDLRQTGFVTLNGREYPHVFDDGMPGVGFSEFQYTPAPIAAQPGEVGFGVMRSIVLVSPSDLDGDGRPELDADLNGIPELDGNGDGIPTDSGDDINGLWTPGEVTISQDTRLSWSNDTVGYIVTPTGINGTSELVRVTGGVVGGREVIARGIDRIQFDTTVSSGFQIPTNTVRVQLFFRVTAPDGTVYRSSYEGRVRTQSE